MHLDVIRHFFSPNLVKKYIDLMALYKFNTFHWHLTDDQGWRIEIKKYPKLTQVGAWRVDQSDKVWGQRPQATQDETPTYGGYYTKEQIKDIVKYAAIRNITIVPEIEMPGHSASAIASYPYLSCTQQPQLPMTGGNYTNISSNYCAGNDSVFTFLQNVLTEVLWSPKELKNWNNFNERLQLHFKALDEKGLHYSKGNFMVEIKPVTQDGKLFVNLYT